MEKMNSFEKELSECLDSGINNGTIKSTGSLKRKELLSFITSFCLIFLCLPFTTNHSESSIFVVVLISILSFFSVSIYLNTISSIQYDTTLREIKEIIENNQLDFEDYKYMELDSINETSLVRKHWSNCKKKLLK